MREPYGKAVAPRTGPAPWRCVRKDVLQALAGERAGWVLSREIIMNPGRRGTSPMPKATPAASLMRDAIGRRAVEDPMHVRFRKNFPDRNWDIPHSAAAVMTPRSAP